MLSRSLGCYVLCSGCDQCLYKRDLREIPSLPPCENTVKMLVMTQEESSPQAVTMLVFDLGLLSLHNCEK